MTHISPSALQNGKAYIKMVNVQFLKKKKKITQLVPEIQ